MKNILSQLKEEKIKTEVKLKKFQEDFSKNPMTTLSWADDSFLDATDLHVIEMLIKAIEKPKTKTTKDSLKNFLLERIVNKAERRSRSTSPTSDLVEESLQSSYAKYYKYFIN